MIRLVEQPRLEWPTVAVRTSYLVGEQADCLLRGTPTDWLGPASEDFARFVAVRRGVRTRWSVPSTVFWYISGEYYLGTLVVRHELTPELAEAGGHVGYHVVAPWRRQGHATRMLTAGLEECRRLGIGRVLLTCDPANEASRKVILANGGKPDGRLRGEDRFWITLELGRAPESPAATEATGFLADVEEREGGDSACWAHRVCPECGGLSEAERPRVCGTCGATFPAY